MMPSNPQSDILEIRDAPDKLISKNRMFLQYFAILNKNKGLLIIQGAEQGLEFLQDPKVGIYMLKNRLENPILSLLMHQLNLILLITMVL